MPLILGFVLIALLVVAGSVAFASAFVQQRDLQDVCDGAAAAAAATAIDLGRTRTDPDVATLPFADEGRVRTAVDAYLARDPDRRRVVVAATVSADRATVTLRCSERRDLPFGRLFGRPTITHTTTSSAEAPTSA
ncbi:MAG: pilus assembly protein TadG-related protein [Jatrophihabitans sp.]|uniref:pilus assembly protein TadG-related protein n=1 Tax=Jatrophihabitans sp. TaxID=1932789 RepID=UPI003F8225E7